jgi:hypothetical protein
MLAAIKGIVIENRNSSIGRLKIKNPKFFSVGKDQIPVLTAYISHGTCISNDNITMVISVDLYFQSNLYHIPQSNKSGSPAEISSQNEYSII